jgi:hypothetical protein
MLRIVGTQKRYWLAFVVLFVVAMAMQANAGTVTLIGPTVNNGSFEDPVVQPAAPGYGNNGTIQWLVPGGGVPLSGWTDDTASGGLALNRVFTVTTSGTSAGASPVTINAYHGNQYATVFQRGAPNFGEFVSQRAGEQTFQANTTYTLTFAYAREHAAPAGSTTPEDTSFTYWLGTKNASSTVKTVSNVPVDTTLPQYEWRQGTPIVVDTAIDTDWVGQVVEIGFHNTGNYVFQLDDVRLIGTTNVPEPSTVVGLAGVALVGLVAVWRRRR